MHLIPIESEFWSILPVTTELCCMAGGLELLSLHQENAPLLNVHSTASVLQLLGLYSNAGIHRILPLTCEACVLPLLNPCFRSGELQPRSLPSETCLNSCYRAHILPLMTLCSKIIITQLVSPHFRLYFHKIRVSPCNMHLTTAEHCLYSTHATITELHGGTYVTPQQSLTLSRYVATCQAILQSIHSQPLFLH